jgi:hypothetical protein
MAVALIRAQAAAGPEAVVAAAATITRLVYCNSATSRSSTV